MAVMASEDIQKFYDAIRRYHLYYEVILAITSFLLNCWVIYLVVTTKNRVMRNYCWVVLMSMFGDFVYTGINFVTMMTIEVKAGRMFFITMGPFEHHGYPFNMTMGCLWLAAMYVTILTIGMQFVYRFYALCKTALTPLKFAGIYSIGLLVCFFDGFVGFWIFDSISAEDTKVIQEHPMYSNNTPAYMILDPSKNGALIHTMCSQAIVVGVYVVIYYTGKRIGEKLNDAAVNMSSSTKDAQKQLTRVMILQAAYPGVIVALPIIVATVLAQLKFDVLWCGMYLAPSISLIPIANSMTILFLIPSFRRRILSKIQNRIQARSESKPFSTDQSKVFKTDTISDTHDDYEHLV